MKKLPQKRCPKANSNARQYRTIEILTKKQSFVQTSKALKQILKFLHLFSHNWKGSQTLNTSPATIHKPNFQISYSDTICLVQGLK